MSHQAPAAIHHLSLSSCSLRCLVIRPLTRFRQQRKLEGFNSRRIRFIISPSNKPVRSLISSKLVRSSQARRTTNEVCSLLSLVFMDDQTMTVKHELAMNPFIKFNQPKHILQAFG